MKILMPSRRDFLKIGASFVIGLGVGYGLFELLKGPTRVTTTSGETLTPPTTTSTTTTASKPSAFKLAFVAFQTGPASIFGVPATNAAKMIVDQINAAGGILGVPIELDIRDESGGSDQQISLYRQLVEQEGVNAYVGLISSEDCLAVAPVAEEIGTTLTVFFDCATKQLVDQHMMKRVVFRTGGTTVTDGVSLARYVVEQMPNLKTVVGLNEDYAYGHDEWDDFKTALLKLKPDVQILDELFTPLFTTDYSAQISKILSLKPDLVHTSFWGPDLVNFVTQATARGLFSVTKVAFARGEFGLPQIPDGQFVEGPYHYSFPYPSIYPINRDFVNQYYKTYKEYPSYEVYHAAQAILGVKYAFEAAAAVENVEWPDLSAVINVFERLAYVAPGGFIVMTSNHNAWPGALTGVSKNHDIELATLKYHHPAVVNPPPGMTSSDWYASWQV